MKTNKLNYYQFRYELESNFEKLRQGNYLAYIIYVLSVLIIFSLICVYSNDHIFLAIFKAILFGFVATACVVECLIYLNFFKNRKIRKYKKLIVLPILKKIEGFVKYVFYSRDYRVQSLSFNSKDKIDDLMVFRRNNYTLYCSEFLSPRQIDRGKKHLNMLQMKFVLDKPWGEQMVLTFQKEPNASAYFSFHLKPVRHQWYYIYSLFEIFTFDHERAFKLHKLLLSVIKIWGEYPRIVIDNDVICIYKQLDKNNFELKSEDYITDPIICNQLSSDLEMLEKILATADLMDSYTENDTSIILSIPSEEKEVEDDLSSYIKSYTKISFYVTRIMVPLLAILLTVISFYLAVSIGIIALYFWLFGVVFLFVALGTFMSRLLNNIVAKRLIKSVCYRFNHSLKRFKYRRRCKREDYDKEQFWYFDYQYLRQHSIECQFSSYKLYLFGDDCFNGTLMEFEYNTKAKGVQLLVHNYEIKIVEDYDGFVLDPALKKCIMAVSDYLRVFNPYLTLNVVLLSTKVQIYVPSSGYIDLTMGLFETPDYELTAQNAVQISRMIRAADKFVETYISSI